MKRKDQFLINDDGFLYYAAGYPDRSRDWLNPYGTNYTPEQRPYGYSEFYIWRKSDKLQNAVYDDRMREWNKTAWDHARTTVAVGKRISQFTQKEATEFLSIYWNKNVTCTALAEGCNASTGYPYFIFFYEDSK